MPVVLVSEAGASVYSVSEIARAEFPDLDPTVRGAISIARRLQDPLAELVKIEPRSIGVGQYQHDVAHAALQRALDAVVEGCVNSVGVNLNTASPHLLARVAGIGPALAAAIVQHREKQGLPLAPTAPRGPASRPEDLRAGGRASFGSGGENPLDDTAVHPERYAALEALAARLGLDARRAARSRRRPGSRGRGPEGGAGGLHLGGHRRRAREAGTRSARRLRAVLVPGGPPEARGPQAGHESARVS